MLLQADDYVVHNIVVSYDITPAIKAQVNIKNLTDTKYYTRIRNNGWAMPGDDRAAILTVAYQF